MRMKITVAGICVFLAEEWESEKLVCRIQDQCAWLEYTGSELYRFELLERMEARIAALQPKPYIIRCLVDVDRTDLVASYREWGYREDEIRIWDGILKGYMMMKLRLDDTTMHQENTSAMPLKKSHLTN